MHKTAVINAVGLTSSLISPEHTPRLHALRQAHGVAHIGGVLPAITTSVQSTYLTGTWPSEHGIVGNGWYFRDTAEVRFWLQSNHLVNGQKIWDRARAMDSTFTCANLFWWYNMYSGADYSVTPRPMYLADGRKLPDIYTQPADLRCHLQNKLGQFPLFKFWGPAADIESTGWIADAAIEVDQFHNPTLTLIYLPHLDYVLQREGPRGKSVPTELRKLDERIGRLLDHYQGREARVMILSEYGISQVSRPVHLNRILREAGLLAVREERGRELLDAGASGAFAVADHQLAHVYVREPGRLAEVARLLSATPGVDLVLDDAGKRQHHLDHPRAGELVCVATADAWFTYYYWMTDDRAPDFARTVEIHRKPGYDPAELFLDPTLRAPKLAIASKLVRRKLGFRTLLDVIPLSANLVKGSHGRSVDGADGPLLISSVPKLLENERVDPTDILNLLLQHVFH